MTHLQINRSLIAKTFGFVLFLGALQSPAVLASGSSGFGGASTGAAKAYNTGKRVLKKKVTCKDCVLAGKKFTKEDAALLLQGKGDANKILPVLSSEEQAALVVYLQRRYKL